MAPIIGQIFHENNEIFGSSKIYAILKDRGYAISESTVAKIMHQNGLFSIRTCAKTLYKQQLERKTNILQQQFHVSRPNEVWVSDVTYFSIFNRMYYICVIIDLYARKVIAHKISKHNSTQLTKATAKTAYELRKPTDTLIVVFLLIRQDLVTVSVQQFYILYKHLTHDVYTFFGKHFDYLIGIQACESSVLRHSISHSISSFIFCSTV